jgi:hypothetical protein
MKSPTTSLAVLLAVLGIEDLAMIPFMVSAPAHNQPPAAATMLSGVLGVVTLACIPGLARGRRWAFWTALATRLLDAVNSFLGLVAGPEVIFKAGGAFALVLSIAAIVLLVRVRPGRAARAATHA